MKSSQNEKRETEFNIRIYLPYRKCNTRTKGNKYWNTYLLISEKEKKMRGNIKGLLCM